MPDILVDYASPVEQTTLTGLSTLPGGHVTVAGEHIAVYGVDDTNCGIWVVVSGGAWTRATDFDTSAEVVFNQQIVPDSSDGSNGVQAGSVFYVATTGTITPGTTAFSILQRTYEEVQVPDIGLFKEGNAWKLTTTGVLAGSYDRLTVDERGRATAGSSSETATTFAEGLRLVWLTNTSFRVEEGAAYVNGTGSIVDLAVDTDITAGSKGLPGTFAVGWYYVYLYSNGGVGDIEVSTTAPSTTPYRGAAREHSTDNTRRYLGAIYASSTTVIRRFSRMSEGFIKWIVSQDGATRVVASGTNTTTSSVDISAVCPPTARGVDVSGWVNNSENNTTLYITASGDGLQTVGTSSGAAQLIVGPNNSATATRMMNSGPIALAGTQALHYYQSATGASRSHHIDVRGYYEDV